MSGKKKSPKVLLWRPQCIFSAQMIKKEEDKPREGKKINRSKLTLEKYSLTLLPGCSHEPRSIHTTSSLNSGGKLYRGSSIIRSF